MSETPDLARYVGREVCDASDGVLLGPVEGIRHLAFDGAEPPEVDVLMVRHIHDDGSLCAYELHEVREHIAECRVLAAGQEPDPEPEPELWVLYRLAPGQGAKADLGRDPEVDGPEVGD